MERARNACSWVCRKLFCGSVHGSAPPITKQNMASRTGKNFQHTISPPAHPPSANDPTFHQPEVDKKLALSCLKAPINLYPTQHFIHLLATLKVGNFLFSAVVPCAADELSGDDAVH